MNIADELRKLQELHSSGGLTEEEFAQAKAVVLQGVTPQEGPVSQEGNLFPINPDEILTPGHLRTMQIIAGSLLAGLIAFLGIAVYIVQLQNHGQGMGAAPGSSLVSLTAVAMLGICAPLAFVLPRTQTRLALRRILAGTWKAPQGFSPTLWTTDGAKLLVVCQTTMIMGWALLEGPGFLGCIAYLFEAQALALGVIGVAIVLILWTFPTEGRVRNWLRRQVDVLSELRQSTSG
jgi:hypothetical protein